MNSTKSQKNMSTFQMEVEASQKDAGQQEPSSQQAPPTPEVPETPSAEQPNGSSNPPEGGNEPAGNEPLPSSTEQKEETPSNTKQLDDYLKEFGLTPDDLNEIKERKAKEKEEAEKPLNEQKRWAKIVSTGIAEGKISKDDVLKYEELANKSDDDIVFENFKKSYKSEYEDLTDDEFEEEAKAEFETQYNARLIKQEAEKIRSEMTSKFNSIESEFLKKETVVNMEKMHNTLFAEVVKQTIKEVVEIDGQKIEVEIQPNVTMAEVKKALKSEQGAPLLEMMFNTFQNNKETSSELFKGFVSNLAKEKGYRDSIANAVWKKAEEHFKDVYSVGAKSPFQGNSQRQMPAGDGVDGTEALMNSLRN